MAPLRQRHGWTRPKRQLYAGILIYATLGVYDMRQSAFDIFLHYAIGMMGFIMRRYDFPAAR
jgi:putative tricarboxylic transport membrane protein